MKKKIALSILVTILVLQPLIAMVGVGAEYTPDEMRSVFSGAQDPGVRLSLGELTNHVPIIIDKTSDFVNQGWPGAGTELDPYTISGLSIVADVDLICISIRNTTAHFLIQDCYIEQGSDLAAIDFLNTTHGTIEWTTVNSTSGTHWKMAAIFLYNANNTRLNHAAVYANEHNAYLAQYSTMLLSEFSYFESTNYRAMRVENGEYCTIDRCEFYNWNYYCVAVRNTNYTTVTNSQMYSDDATSGLAIYDCDFSYVTNVYIWAPGDSQGALNIDLCNEMSVNGVTVDSCNVGIDVGNCPDIYFENCSVSEASSFGIRIQFSANASFLQCDVNDVGDSGIWMYTCDNSTIQECTFTDTGHHGMYIEASQDVIVEDVTITIAIVFGVYLENCNRPTLSNLDVSFCSSKGFNVYNSPNGSIVNTTISNIDGDGFYCDTNCDYWFISNLDIQYVTEYGLYLADGVECDVVNNYISNTGDNAVRLDVVENVTFTDNQIFNSESEGLSISEAWLAYIANNHIQNCSDGFRIDQSDNVTIMNMEILDSVEIGMDLNDMEYPIVSNINISAGYRGIQLGFVYYGVFDNIAMSGSGVHMSAGGIPIAYLDHAFTDVTVNGMDVYYAKHVEDMAISGTTYGQIILVNCSNFNVTGGIFDYCSTAVHVLLSEHVTLRDMSSSYNSYGAFVANSENITIIDFDVYGRQNARNIYGAYVDVFEIIDSSFTRATDTGGHDIYLDYCEVVDIIGCNFSYSYKSIYAYWTGNLTMVDLDIRHMEAYGIHVWGDSCDYMTLEDSTMYNVTRGLYSDRGQYWIVRGNTISHNQYYALYFGSNSGDYGLVESNTLESNQDGIYFSGSDEYVITDNTIRWNTRYGIYLTSSTNTNVTYNIIAFSGTDNGYDDRSGNYWDNHNSTGIPLGNYWSDYTPPAPYEVDGDTDDRYPMQYAPTTPIVDHPMDITFAEFSTGNEITWQPRDDSLHSWEAYIDGEFWAGDAWDFSGTVVVNVDELGYGQHTIEITIFDVDMNNVTDTVNIQVFDDTAPGINGPANTVSFLDATGQILTWEVSDLHPGTYEVDVNGEIVETGTWTTGTVDYNIDGLDLGVNQVTLLIYDLDMNSAGASVLVEVVDDDDSPTIDHPDDMEMVEGTTGNQIVWSPSDDYPDRFEVSYNGSAYVTDSWGGSRIVVSMDGLPAGTHSFSLTVYDEAGNQVSDEVVVTVIAVEPETTPPPPADYGLLLIVGATAGAVVVVVIVIYALKKRRAA